MKKRLTGKLTAIMVSLTMLAITLQCSLQAAAGEAVTEAAEAISEAASEDKPAYTIDNIHDYVVGLDEPVELADGSKRPAINFDNAATTPALQPVVDEVTRELQQYGSIGRGFSQKSNHSTTIYHQTR